MDINDAKKLFDEILEANRDRHAPVKVGQKLTLEHEKRHAHDVLQWVEQLDSGATIETRIAALFHDVDRIVNPERARRSKYDRRSPEYFEHKKAHAQRSADYIGPVLLAKGVPQRSVDKIEFLIIHHDDQEKEVLSYNDKELDLLVAADSLSFFESFAINLLEELGEEQVRGKIEFMLAKMPERFRSHLKKIHLNHELLDRIKNETLSKLHT